VWLAPVRQKAATHSLIQTHDGLLKFREVYLATSNIDAGTQQKMKNDDPQICPDYAPYTSQEELQADLGRVLNFFWSMREEDPCGPKQIEARRVCARMLRAAYDDEGRWQSLLILAMFVASGLANLLDPDNTKEPYELVLRRRTGQKGPVPISESAERNVVNHIRDQLRRLAGSSRQRGSDQAPHGRMKVAIADAMKRFGLSRGRVYDIWSRRRPPFKPQPPAPNIMVEPLPADASKIERAILDAFPDDN
jgi:hypothetical protein